MSTVTLPSLPFSYDALEPHISKETLELHHDKHHATYVANANNLLVGSELEGKDIETIIKSSSGGLFNNVAQSYNHDFYWKSLSPKQTKPSEKLSKLIERDFGSMDNFKAEFAKNAVGNFGSGWTWLTIKADKLNILNTSNADTAIMHDELPLFVCDVWEHAYYVDYRNRRAEYLESFFGLINWDFASKNLEI